MSLQRAGAWAAGVWAPTAWADGVWRESAAPSGGSGEWRAEQYRPPVVPVVQPYVPPTQYARLHPFERPDEFGILRAFQGPVLLDAHELLSRKLGLSKEAILFFLNEIAGKDGLQ